MESSSDLSREQFLTIAKTNGLYPEGPYQDKLFIYVRNFAARNRLLYDIDVSEVEPMSIVTCFGADKK